MEMGDFLQLEQTNTFLFLRTPDTNQRPTCALFWVAFSNNKTGNAARRKTTIAPKQLRIFRDQFILIPKHNFCRLATLLAVFRVGTHPQFRAPVHPAVSYFP